MKKYPRIYNLCTIGIIHHQEFEYKFHPFRTDFIGDSGTGKSIVADLLQLIIVGGSHYKSSTEGNDDRPVNGLVLSSGQRSDFGYAFINVETKENEFITLGVYIESSNTNVRSFIIQKSVNFDKDATSEKVILLPLNEPTKITQFEDQSKWQPVDVLQDLFHEKYQLGFKHWLRIKDFHKILYDNKILSLDLSRDTGTLVNYAKILRAFSRKNIDFKKKNSLKEFLFGKENATIFLEKYKATAKVMKETVDSYQKNLSEIENIERIKEGLDKLFKLKTQSDQAESTWSKAYWSKEKLEHQDFLKEIKKSVVEFYKSLDKLKVLEELKINKKSVLNKALPEQSEIDSYFDELQVWKNKKTSAEKISVELSEANLTLEKLIQDYETYQKNKTLIKAFQELKHELDTENLKNLFEKINWSKGYSEGIKELESILINLEKEKSEKVSLQKFSDIENVNSLGHWAIKREKKLSEMEESVILHYQAYDIVKPPITQKERYIPNPKEVINALDQRIEYEEDGFWLNLGGIHEFIKITESPFLSVLSNAEIEKHFELIGKELSDKITEIENELTVTTKLKDILIEKDFSQNAVTAFELQKNDQLEINNDLKIYTVTNDEFYECISNYKIIDDVAEKHSAANVKYNKIIDSKAEIKQLMKNLDNHKSFDPEEINNLEEIEAIRLKYKIDKPQDEDFNFEFQMMDHSDYFEAFRKTYDITIVPIKNVNEIIGLNSRIDTIKLGIENHEIEYSDSEFKILPLSERQDPDPLKIKFDTDKSDYIIEYKTLVNAHIKNDKGYFLDNESFEELSRVLLPEILKEIDFNETEISQAILDYLNQINNKNRELNQSKLVNIRLLLDELYTEIDKQLNAIRTLGNFFNKKEAEITGNHKASIDKVLKAQYPISWIQDFKQELNDSGDGLFREKDGLIDKMEKLSTLEEKIIHAFREYSNTGYRHADLKEILNPYSYYSVTYRIENAKGKKNSGSTGQSYAALALLCIAKLSLINDDKKSDIPGLRFMAIDEVAGIGTNFDMLKKIAKIYDYQIISQSIETVKPIKGQHNIFNLYKNKNTDDPINRHPQAVISV